MAGHRVQVVVNGSVEGGSEAVAGSPPPADSCETEIRIAAHSCPVLVGDGVSPGVEVFQPVPPRLAVRIDGLHRWPELHPEPGEVGAQVARVGVAVVELPSLREEHSQQVGGPGRLGVVGREVHRLGVQVTAEALELGRQQRRVGVVDLERGVPAAPPTTADGPVCRFDFVQSDTGSIPPLFERDGWHRWILTDGSAFAEATHFLVTLFIALIVVGLILELT